MSYITNLGSISSLMNECLSNLQESLLTQNDFTVFVFWSSLSFVIHLLVRRKCSFYWDPRISLFSIHAIHGCRSGIRDLLYVLSLLWALLSLNLRGESFIWASICCCSPVLLEPDNKETNKNISICLEKRTHDSDVEGFKCVSNSQKTFLCSLCSLCNRFHILCVVKCAVIIPSRLYSESSKAYTRK